MAKAFADEQRSIDAKIGEPFAGISNRFVFVVKIAKMIEYFCPAIERVPNRSSAEGGMRSAEFRKTSLGNFFYLLKISKCVEQI